ncbi:MAG: hypothetical protein BWX84_00118 [Verrucomicrobia bacterium ADurb.Bin118]|nr:MAG: hypothetical protein BWX84_00118 [Verrucomicrobia bacterium ADurb.Bin118]
MVRDHQDIAGLLKRRFQLIEIGDLHVYVREPRIRNAAAVVGGAETQPGRVQRDVNRLVFAGERPVAAAKSPGPRRARHRGLGLFRGLLAAFSFLFPFVMFKQTHDGEWLVVDENDLPQRHNGPARPFRVAK